MAVEHDPKEMSLIEHLDELRNCIIAILIAVTVCSIAGWGLSEQLLQLFLAKAGKEISFVALAPTEGFMTQLKLGILFGLLASFPYNLLKLWSFIAPALHIHEAKVLYRTTPFLVILFLSGVLLAYFFVIPLGLKFLLTFQVAEVKATLSIEKYISFCVTLLLVFGILFELPVFLVLLAYVGLVNESLLRKYRAHVIVTLFVLAALLTPPDIVTQTLVAIPMILLYEISILFIRMFVNQRESDKPQEEGEPS